MKKPNLKDIETRIDGFIAFAWYEQYYRSMREIEMQSAWYATQEGKNEVGEETAEKQIEANTKTVGIIKQKLAFAQAKINGAS